MNILNRKWNHHSFIPFPNQRNLVGQSRSKFGRRLLEVFYLQSEASLNFAPTELLVFIIWSKSPFCSFTEFTNSFLVSLRFYLYEQSVFEGGLNEI